MIAVIDYGLGNLRSVGKALEVIGTEAEVSNNPEKIAGAKAIVLPGVGAFQRGMENLERLNILPSLFKAIRDGKPFLGICLGLQLLFTESEEHGIHKGMDIIKGRVKRFDSDLKVPHMGWNKVKLKIKNEKLKIFENIPDESYFYFVHTYYVEPEDKEAIVATTDYGQDFVSVLNKDNVWGVQFHPEKSAGIGLKLLENFLSLC
jgi:glutamine amidotransferase